MYNSLQEMNPAATLISTNFEKIRQITKKKIKFETNFTNALQHMHHTVEKSNMEYRQS